jgi:hypothetical protein
MPVVYVDAEVDQAPGTGLILVRRGKFFLRSDVPGDNGVAPGTRQASAHGRGGVLWQGQLEREIPPIARLELDRLIEQHPGSHRRAREPVLDREPRAPSARAQP